MPHSGVDCSRVIFCDCDLAEQVDSDRVWVLLFPTHLAHSLHGVVYFFSDLLDLLLKRKLLRKSVSCRFRDNHPGGAVLLGHLFLVGHNVNIIIRPAALLHKDCSAKIKHMKRCARQKQGRLPAFWRPVRHDVPRIRRFLR